MRDLKGIGVSPGIAIGRAMVIGRWEQTVPRYQIAADAVQSELRRFWTARRRARDEIRALRDQAARRLGAKYAAIFDVHVMMVEDRKLGREIVERVRDQRMNAEWALAASMGRLVASMQQVEDPMLRERGSDVQDVYERLLRLLGGKGGQHATDLALAEDTVVVAHNLSPSDAMWLHQPKIVGFVTETGGPTSHTAILANALEIAAVVGVERVTETIEEGDQLVVDGARGAVVWRPGPGQVAAYRQQRDAWRRYGEAIEAAPGPVATRDGTPLRVLANIEFPEEMATVAKVGAHGVGLYRSEFLFLTVAPNLPTEDDHVQAYRRIARGAAPSSVVIRTLDLGGEKYFHEVLEANESNPVLGLRAVRFCLSRPDIFRTQLRGLLRVAAESRNVSILVPMVSGLEEWRAVVQFVDTVREELIQEGLRVPKTRLGPMIEIPAAALIADHLARESDFLSIGTNDLIQYTVAVDRGNRRVAHLYDPWHPAVLRLVENTIAAGRRAGIPVSLCGEMASDPLGALTLLGLGLEEFSCNPLVIPDIRAVLRAASAAESRRAVAEAIELANGAEIRARLAEQFAEVLAARPSAAGGTARRAGKELPSGPALG